MNKRMSKGFTLLELMIVVVIIALLAALAYVNYSRFAFRTRRADGREMLMRVASAEERFYTANNRYTATAAQLQMGALTSEKGYYGVTVALANSNQSYTLTAAPVAPQDKDACANLTLDNAGQKGQSGSASNGACW
jgi:type IV pilus assembly protein PilE